MKHAPIIGSAHNGPAFKARSNPRFIALFIASVDKSYWLKYNSSPFAIEPVVSLSWDLLSFVDSTFSSF